MKFPIQIGFYFDQPQQETQYLKEIFQSALRDIDGEKLFEVLITVFPKADQLLNNNCHVTFIEVSKGSPLVMFSSGYLSAKKRFLKFLENEQEPNPLELPLPVRNHRIAYSVDLKSYVHTEPFKKLIGGILESEIKNYFEFQNQFENIWFKQTSKDSIYIIGGPNTDELVVDDIDDILNSDIYNYGDKDTFIETCMFLAKHFNSAVLEKRNSNGNNIYDSDHMVIIGGPGRTGDPGNKYCEKMMNLIQSKAKYGYDNRGYFLKVSEKEWRADVSPDGRKLKHDIGYFATFINPDNGRRVILINGIHTLGVLGSFKAFSDAAKATENYRTLLKSVAQDASLFKKYKKGVIEFECIFVVKPSPNGVMTPEIKTEDINFINHIPKPKKVTNRTGANQGAVSVQETNIVDFDSEIPEIFKKALRRIQDDGHQNLINNLKEKFESVHQQLNIEGKRLFYNILDVNRSLPVDIISQAESFLDHV